MNARFPHEDGASTGLASQNVCTCVRLTTSLLALFFCACAEPQAPEFLNVHDPRSSSFAPNIPSGLSAQNANESQRLLTWQDNSGFESGYRIERRLGASSAYVLIGQTPANVHSFLDTTSILTDTTYIYRVNALSDGGRTSSFDSLAVFIPFPGATDLHMTCLSPTSIQIEWEDNSDFELGSSIEESVNNQPFAEVGRVAANVISLIRSGLNGANSYRFRVQAYSQHNRSRFSNTLSISLVTSQSELLYSRRIQQLDQSVYAVTFSPDGKVLACGGDFAVDLLRVGDGITLARLPHTYNSPVWSIQYSPDGTNLATANGVAVELWNPNTYVQIGRLSVSFNESIFSTVSFSPGGDTLAAADSDGAIQLWRVSSRTYLRSYTGFNSDNRSVDISPDGQFIATGNVLTILRLSNGSVVRAFPTSAFLNSIVYHPTGGFVACVGGNGFMMQLWNVSDGSLVRTFQDTDYLRDIAFDPSGDRIAAAGNHNALINIWQVQSGALLLTLNNSSQSLSVAFSPLNNIIATGDDHGTVRVWGFSGVWKTDL